MAIFTNVRLNDQSRRSELGDIAEEGGGNSIYVSVFCSFGHLVPHVPRSGHARR